MVDTLDLVAIHLELEDDGASLLSLELVDDRRPLEDLSELGKQDHHVVAAHDRLTPGRGVEAHLWMEGFHQSTAVAVLERAPVWMRRCHASGPELRRARRSN